MRFRKVLLPFLGIFFISSCSGPSIELSENALECKLKNGSNGYWLDNDILYSGKDTWSMDRFGEPIDKDFYEEYFITDEDKVVITREGLLDDNGKQISLMAKRIDFAKGEVTVVVSKGGLFPKEGTKWMCE